MFNSRDCTEPKRLFVITGLSGAGKSVALRAFEDLNYFAIDGLPASLAPEVAKMMEKEQMRRFCGMALVMDMREDNFLPDLGVAIKDLSRPGMPLSLIFLEADNETLMRRYASTRRPHPLERKGQGLEAAIRDEREQLKLLRDMANLVIDSSGFSIHDLRREILKFGQKPDDLRHNLRINLVSFGFKYGLPKGADFVFDLRFLPNPYFVDELRPFSGKDKAIADYIFKYPQAANFRQKTLELLFFALEQMEKDGRARVTVALGCTGGRHRSVAMAEEVAHALTQAGYRVALEHKNLENDKYGR